MSLHLNRAMQTSDAKPSEAHADASNRQYGPASGWWNDSSHLQAMNASQTIFPTYIWGPGVLLTRQIAVAAHFRYYEGTT